MKKIICCALILCFATVGCTGSFNLTKKVYDTHRSQDDKWADELMFLVFIIVPVYGISTFADAVIFNSIEFWTGDNPVVYNPDDNTKFVEGENGEVEITYLNEDKLLIESVIDGKNNEPVILEKTPSGVVAKDKDGNLLYTSVKSAEGHVSVYDKNDRLVKTFTAE